MRASSSCKGGASIQRWVQAGLQRSAPYGSREKRTSRRIRSASRVRCHEAEVHIERLMGAAPSVLPLQSPTRIGRSDAKTRLESAGYPLSGGPVRFGPHAQGIFVRDPDGNVIELH